MADWYSSDFDGDTIVIVTYGHKGAAVEPVSLSVTRALTKPIGEARLRQLQEELRIATLTDRR